MKKLLFITVLSLLSVTSFAADRRACRDDAKKFCPGVRGREMMKCMKEHQSELSKECQEAAAAGKDRVKEVIQDCAQDAKKFCKDTERGHGKILKCLKENSASLSPACKADLEKK